VVTGGWTVDTGWWNPGEVGGIRGRARGGRLCERTAYTATLRGVDFLDLTAAWPAVALPAAQFWRLDLPLRERELTTTTLLVFTGIICYLADPRGLFGS
jgi:hypothetical protein